MKWVPICIILFNGIMFFLLPAFQRRNLFFAVPVEEDFANTPRAKSLLRLYQLVNIAATLLAIGAVLFLTHFEDHLVGVIVAQQAVALGLFAWIRNRIASTTTPPPAAIHSTSLAAESPEVPGMWAFLLLPFLILAGAGMYLSAHWADIPQRFPIHFDLNGNPNGWSTKGVKGVFGILLFGALLQCVFLFLIYGIKTGTRRAVPGSPRMRFMKANIWMLMIIQWFLGILFGYISLLPIWGAKPAGWLIGGFTVALVGTVMAFTFYMVKLQGQPTDSENTPDSSWILGGMFYYNPEDPALLVEKRFGLGYTFNMANRISWGFFVMVALVVLLPTVLFR